MTEISIHASITKTVDELENEIFFSLSREELKDFILSLDEKVGSVDFTINIIKQLTNVLVDYYGQYTDSVVDESFKNEYKILNQIKETVQTFRKPTE